MKMSQALGPGGRGFFSLPYICITNKTVFPEPTQNHLNDALENRMYIGVP